MLKWVAVMGGAMTLFFATPALAYDVSYSTSDSIPTCPQNASLINKSCYCNVGYTVSGTQCVKIQTPAPAPTEIYSDIKTAVDLNDGVTCDRLAVLAADMDMCRRYFSLSKEARLTWKGIERPPATIANAIENPWAPPSQQSMNIGSIVPAVPPPPPPPPPAATTTAVATSTKAATTTDAALADDSADADAEAEKVKMGQAFQKILEDREKEKSAPTTNAVGSPQNPAGPSPALLALSVKLAAEEQDASDTPPQAVYPDPNAQTAQAAQAAPEETPGFFARIVGFFKWLF